MSPSLALAKPYARVAADSDAAVPASAAGTPRAGDAADGAGAGSDEQTDGRCTTDSVSPAHLPVAGEHALPATESDAAEAVMRVTIPDDTPHIHNPRELSEEAAHSEYPRSCALHSVISSAP